MKKTIIALGLGAFIAIAFSSCQKKYTCTCTTGDLKDPFEDVTGRGDNAAEACAEESDASDLKVCIPKEKE